MGMPAARITDLHVCPLLSGGTGPIIKGEFTVITAKMPQARVSDVCVCLAPTGDPIVTGAWNVLVGSMPAARMTDMTAGGGVISTGAFNVLIGMSSG